MALENLVISSEVIKKGNNAKTGKDWHLYLVNTVVRGIEWALIKEFVYGSRLDDLIKSGVLVEVVKAKK